MPTHTLIHMHENMLSHLPGHTLTPTFYFPQLREPGIAQLISSPSSFPSLYFFSSPSNPLTHSFNSLLPTISPLLSISLPYIFSLTLLFHLSLSSSRTHVQKHAHPPILYLSHSLSPTLSLPFPLFNLYLLPKHNNAYSNARTNSPIYQ